MPTYDPYPTLPFISFSRVANMVSQFVLLEACHQQELALNQVLELCLQHGSAPRVHLLSNEGCVLQDIRFASAHLKYPWCLDFCEIVIMCNSVVALLLVDYPQLSSYHVQSGVKI